MRKVITIISLLAGYVTESYSQGCPTNADFELGNKTNWTCKYGGYGVGTAPNLTTFYSTNACINTGGNNAPADANNRHTVMGPGAGNDGRSINPLVPKVAPGNLFPSGTNTYSFRVGNDATGGYNWPGPNPPALNYAQAEAISITFTVNPQNAGFTYVYACFVQDPGHAWESQPRFEIVIRDENGNQTPCGYYKVVAGDTLAKTFYVGGGNYQYTNWTKVGLDLTAQMGKQVTIEFRTSDCFPPSGGTSTSIVCSGGSCTTTQCQGTCCTTCISGNPTCVTTGCSGGSSFAPGSHSAYAYVDAYCTPLEIYQPIFCNPASSVQLCAPPGFLSYTWPAGQSGLTGSPNTRCVTVNNPVPGTTYTVNMTTVTQCASVAYVTLDALTISVNDTSICYGTTNSFQLNATPNLPGNYTYSWTPSTGLSCTTCPNPTLNSIPTSTTTYTVSVYNQTALCGVDKPLTITITPTPPSSVVDSICPGEVKSFTAPNNPSHSWYSGGVLIGSGGSINIGNPGTYTDTMRTALGCKQVHQVTVTNRSISASTSSINPLCNGGSNGTATVTPTGGIGGYTYTWSTNPVQSGSTATNLSSGTYTVTVKDSRGCSNVQTVTLSQPTAVTNTPSVNGNISCFGGNNGVATTTPGGGTPGYTYTWLPGNQTTQTISNLSSLTYTVTVRDANGCSNRQTISLTQPTAVTNAPSVNSNVNCLGGNNGVATTTPGGGTPGYTYTWLPGGQTTQTISNLTSGTYTVTVRDANGCTNRQTVSISQPTTAVSATVTAGGNVSCFGGNNGTASVTPTGGTPNYTYFWQPGGQTTSSISGLASGTFTVTVTDANGCTNRQSVTISQPPGSLSSTVSAVSNVNCYGGSNGIAMVGANGGTPGYTYQWQPGGQTTQTISNLVNGTYTVAVRDAQGCSNVQLVAITQPNAPLTSTVSATGNVNCFGGNNGGASVTPSGGTATYTYLWQPGGQTTPSVTNISSGTYTVTVTDANGCTNLQTVTISQPNTALTSTVSVISNVNCFGGNNGVATVSPGGGTPGYTYTWLSGGQTTQTISNLASGTYTVTVRDANGCTNLQTVTISQPNTSVSATVSVGSNVSCFGGLNGSASVTPLGGTPTYAYSWLPGGQTTSSISGLSSGTFTVTVTDANGCTTRQTVFISQPTASLTSTVNAVSNVNCFGGSNGIATVGGNGGTPVYTYQWQPGGLTTQTISNLVAGSYTVTIRDAQGCSNSNVLTVSQPSAPLTSSVSATTNVNCFGGNNGSGTVNVSGGTPAYTYTWLPGGQNAPTLYNMQAGTYTVLISDSKGCTSRQNVVITQPINAVNATYVSTPASCNKNDGTVTVTASGGTPGYTYQWNPNVSTTNSASGLSSGVFNITVTDSKGCSQQITATVNQPPGVTGGFTYNPASGLAPLSVNFTNGSTGGTVYKWNFGDTTIKVIQDSTLNPKHLYKDSGTYVIRLIVYNQWGCADTVYATIRVNMKSTLCVPNVFSPNGDGKNDVWKLCQPGIEYLEVAIYDRWGLLIYEWDTPNGGWDGRTTAGQEVPEGTYYYIIKAKGTDQVDYGTTGGFLMLLRN